MISIVKSLCDYDEDGQECSNAQVSEVKLELGGISITINGVETIKEVHGVLSRALEGKINE